MTNWIHGSGPTVAYQFMDWLLPVTWWLLRSSSSSFLSFPMRVLRVSFSLIALCSFSCSLCNASWSIWAFLLSTSTSRLFLADSCLASFSSSSDCLRSVTCTCSVSTGQRNIQHLFGLNMLHNCVYNVLLPCNSCHEQTSKYIIRNHLLFTLLAAYI